MPDERPVCDCCRLATARPGHRVKEYGGQARLLTFCRPCTACWTARPDGTVAIPARCPQALRPTFRQVGRDE